MWLPATGEKGEAPLPSEARGKKKKSVFSSTNINRMPSRKGRKEAGLNICKQ